MSQSLGSVRSSLGQRQVEWGGGGLETAWLAKRGLFPLPGVRTRVGLFLLHAEPVGSCQWVGALELPAMG